MNPYEVLDVDVNADADRITAAYRKLSKEYHADRNPGDPVAAHRYAEVQEAYAILDDPVRRAEYDSTGRSPPRRDPYEELRTILTQELIIAMRDSQTWGGTVKERDLVNSMVGGIRRKQAEVEQLLEHMDKDEKEFREVLRRLTVADDVNIFEEPLKAQLAGIERHRGAAKDDLDRLQRVLKYLEKCKYKVGNQGRSEFGGLILESTKKSAVGIRKRLGLPEPKNPDDKPPTPAGD